MKIWNRNFDITPKVKKQLIEQFAPKIYKIKSEDSGKEYLITLARNHFECSCPSFLYCSRDKNGLKKEFYCKHQKHLAYKLLNGAKQNV